MSIVDQPDYNPQKHYLGNLCKQQHDYLGTGYSLKFRSNDECWHCKKAYMTNYDRSLVPQRKNEREQRLALVEAKIVDLPNYDANKFRLGNLCREKHSFRGTGQSLRYKSNRQCFFCHSEKSAKSYAENREERLAQRRKFKEENYEYCLQRRREYKKNNRELFREIEARYRNSENGKKLVKASIKRYNKTEKGRIRAVRGAHKRRVTLRNGHHEFYSKEDIQNLFERFGLSCAYCGKHQSKLENVLEIEHVVPITKGGADRLQNFVPACRSCNNSKRAKMLTDWYLKQNFATLDRLNKIILQLGSEEIEQIGLQEIEHGVSFLQQKLNPLVKAD
jgi:5-methylcytosine-specific restriction endonuclease McrA